MTINVEYEMEIGQPNNFVHFSPLLRKTNQKEARQNEAPKRRARTIPAVLPGQHTKYNRTQIK